MLPHLINVDKFNHCTSSPLLFLNLLDIIHKFSIHGTTDQLRLNGISGDHLDHLPSLGGVTKSRLLRTVSSQIWLSVRMEESTALLGNLSQSLVTLTVKFNFKNFEMDFTVLHAHCLVQSPLRRGWLCLYSIPSDLYTYWWDPSEPFLFQVQQRLSQPCLLWEMLHTFNHLNIFSRLALVCPCLSCTG